jgi:hypothetical protein
MGSGGGWRLGVGVDPTRLGGRCARGRVRGALAGRWGRVPPAAQFNERIGHVRVGRGVSSGSGGCLKLGKWAIAGD